MTSSCNHWIVNVRLNSGCPKSKHFLRRWKSLEWNSKVKYQYIAVIWVLRQNPKYQYRDHPVGQLTSQVSVIMFKMSQLCSSSSKSDHCVKLFSRLIYQQQAWSANHRLQLNSLMNVKTGYILTFWMLKPAAKETHFLSTVWKVYDVHCGCGGVCHHPHPLNETIPIIGRVEGFENGMVAIRRDWQWVWGDPLNIRVFGLIGCWEREIKKSADEVGQANLGSVRILKVSRNQPTWIISFQHKTGEP